MDCCLSFLYKLACKYNLENCFEPIIDHSFVLLRRVSDKLFIHYKDGDSFVKFYGGGLSEDAGFLSISKKCGRALVIQNNFAMSIEEDQKNKPQEQQYEMNSETLFLNSHKKRSLDETVEQMRLIEKQFPGRITPQQEYELNRKSDLAEVENKRNQEIPFHEQISSNAFAETVPVAPENRLFNHAGVSLKKPSKTQSTGFYGNVDDFPDINLPENHPLFKQAKNGHHILCTLNMLMRCVHGLRACLCKSPPHKKCRSDAIAKFALQVAKKEIKGMKIFETAMDEKSALSTKYCNSYIREGIKAMNTNFFTQMIPTLLPDESEQFRREMEQFGEDLFEEMQDAECTLDSLQDVVNDFYPKLKDGIVKLRQAWIELVCYLYMCVECVWNVFGM